MSTKMNDTENAKKMTRVVIDALEEKKAEDIRIIDISTVSVMADYFVIASGNNRNQIQAMIDNVEEQLHKAGFEVKQVEGYDTANWILMDCRDVIVHVFDKENRLFYDLERIWRDGKLISSDEI
ncbi:MAG TPA: ribosome silencing factor [Lachnospiraceae bacterium]|nr:ribosome silencing factor [Lachnospiraceae bacterium]